VVHLFAGTVRIAEVRNGSVLYHHKDHLGSATVLTDKNGNRVETAEYLPFGELRESTGSWTTDYKFTDQELDTETGLYNFNARLYDPAVGRFISPDPAVPDLSDATNTRNYDPQMFNRYAYCRNNPLIYIDPTGLFMAETTAGDDGGQYSEGSSNGGDFPDTTGIDGPTPMIVIGSDGVTIFGPGNKSIINLSFDKIYDFISNDKAWADMRQAIELIDVASQGAGPVTVAFDIAGLIATQIDIYNAKIEFDKKIEASLLNIVGFLGIVGALPAPQSVVIGLAIDATVFTKINRIINSSSSGQRE
jgi:RHS repeat-associated protein